MSDNANIKNGEVIDIKLKNNNGYSHVLYLDDKYFIVNPINHNYISNIISDD